MLISTGESATMDKVPIGGEKINDEMIQIANSVEYLFFLNSPSPCFFEL